MSRKYRNPSTPREIDTSQCTAEIASISPNVAGVLPCRAWGDGICFKDKKRATEVPTGVLGGICLADEMQGAIDPVTAATIVEQANTETRNSTAYLFLRTVVQQATSGEQ